jgi:hypothetical protein
MTHTPGPWFAEPGVGRGAWIKNKDGRWAALACGETEEEAKANAQLIMIAPDMLELLEAIEPHMHNIPHSSGLHAAVQALLRKPL